MAWPATVPRWHPACFAALLAAALGCDATRDDDYRVRLDLSHCVAQDEQPDGCRMRLRDLAPPGLAACLVIRPLDDPSRTHRLPLVWDAAQLVPPDGAPPPTLLPGEVVHAALFALGAPAGLHGRRSRGGVRPRRLRGALRPRRATHRPVGHHRPRLPRGRRALRQRGARP